MQFWWVIGLCFGLSSASAEDLTHERKTELLNLLKHDCGSCHGISLRGGLGNPLNANAIANVPDPVLFDAIRNGRPGTAMPAWRAFLSDSDITWLISQIRTFP